jgi:hypothetical protein
MNFMRTAEQYQKIEQEVFTDETLSVFRQKLSACSAGAKCCSKVSGRKNTT